MNRRPHLIVVALVMTAAAFARSTGSGGLIARSALQQSCESLSTLSVPHTTIVSAQAVPEGPLNTAGAAVPARCVVKAVAKPSADSEIHFEVWLPASGWNGKYQQAGNGGWAGSIPTAALAQ